MVTRAVGLPEPGKGSEGVTFSITGMAAAAAGGNEKGTQASQGSENLVGKGNIALSMAEGLGVGQPFQGAVQNILVPGQRGLQLRAGWKQGGPEDDSA